MYIKIRNKLSVTGSSRRIWYFLMSDGGSSRKKIHAVKYPSLESAQKELAHIEKNYPEFEAEIVEKL